MDIKVSGAKDCFKLAHALREARETGLKRELDRGAREAGDVIAKAVTDPNSTDKYIPKGFERAWAGSMQSRVEVRLLQSHRISVVFWAMGKQHRRKIEAINAGTLKHPVFRRTRRLKAGGRMKNPWVTQSIKPGVVTEPAAAAMPAAVKKIDEAVGRVAAKIGRAS